MNVSFEKKNDLEALLTIRLSKEDYQPKVDQQLKVFRKTARIPGFRPGTAPMGMIKKMVGQSILVDEVNKLAGDTLNTYLRENKVDILGHPMSSQEHDSEVDFNTEGSEFVLHFDIALSPEFNIAIGQKDSLTLYKPQVSDQELEEELSAIKKHYSTRESVTQAESENDSLKVRLTELNAEGMPLDGGVNDKSTTILPEIIKDEATKNIFSGIKVGDQVSADIFKVFNDNTKVMTSVLGLPEEGLNDLEKNFRFEVEEIQKMVPAELNQELYDTILGAGTVSGDEAFREEVRNRIQRNYEADANHILTHELDNLVLEKHRFPLPDEMLKRWLLETKSEDYNEGNITEEYEKQKDALRYQLIRDKVALEQNMQVSDEELKQMNYMHTSNMLAQYGMNNAGREFIESFAARQEQDSNHMQRMYDVALSGKVNAYFKTLITVKEEAVSVEKFKSILDEHNKKHHNH